MCPIYPGTGVLCGDDLSPPKGKMGIFRRLQALGKSPEEAKAFLERGVVKKHAKEVYAANVPLGSQLARSWDDVWLTAKKNSALGIEYAAQEAVRDAINEYHQKLDAAERRQADGVDFQTRTNSLYEVGLEGRDIDGTPMVQMYPPAMKGIAPGRISEGEIVYPAWWGHEDIPAVVVGDDGDAYADGTTVPIEDVMALEDPDDKIAYSNGLYDTQDEDDEDIQSGLLPLPPTKGQAGGAARNAVTSVMLGGVVVVMSVLGSLR
jgi:hypothetical protein